MKSLTTKPYFYPLLVALIVAVLFGIFWWLVDGTHIPVLEPNGVIASQQLDLIIFTVVLSAIVVVPVFGMLAVFAFRYREGNTKKVVYKPEWSSNKWLEIIWWGIPILIIVVLSVVTVISSHKLDPYREIADNQKPLTVQVVALQWKWLFLYPELGVATVNDLTIPVDRSVTFRLSADAPMSAFWIPELGGHIYTMNSMSSQLNLKATEQGVYKGYNTNINGKGYSDMVATVNVVSSDEFDAWHTKHANSGHVLTASHLAALSQPSVPSAPMYMRLEDENLYQSVVMQNMTHGENKSESEHRTTSDSMNKMEGMSH